jgi:hypothetical protein
VEQFTLTVRQKSAAGVKAWTACLFEQRVPAEPNTKLIVEDQRQSIAGSASLGASDHWGAVLAASGILKSRAISRRKRTSSAAW